MSRGAVSNERPVILDACCGSRMFWFDRAHPDVVFMDNRREVHMLRDSSSAGGERTLIVSPDLVADFTNLPFADEHFALVVFDPPHLIRSGRKSWLARKYGKLGANWQDEIRQGFSECFRVLRPLGTMIFKWNENDIPVSQVLALTPNRPTVGNRCGKSAKSHWIVFLKAELSHDRSVQRAEGAVTESPKYSQASELDADQWDADFRAKEYLERLHKLSGRLNAGQYVSVDAAVLHALLTQYLAQQDSRKAAL